MRADTESQPAMHASAAPTPQDEWRWVRRALGEMRGRARKVALLGIAGGLVGCLVGWLAVGTQYRSEAAVRVASVLPQVMQQTDQNAPMAMFDAYLQSQQLFISSRGMIESAIRTPAWKATGRPDSPQAQADFARNLSVETKSGTDYVRIGFVDRDPAVAAAAVNAVVSAYEQTYNAQQNQLEQQRCQCLEQRQRELAGQLQTEQARIQQMMQEFGTADLDLSCYASIQRANKLKSDLSELRLALSSPSKPGRSGERSELRSPGSPALSIEQIALVDPLMSKYFDTLIRRQDDLANAHLRGYGDTHPEILRLDGLVALANDRVLQRQQEYLAAHQTPTAAANQPTSSGAFFGDSPETLRIQEWRLSQLYAQAKTETSVLGAKRLELDRLQSDQEAGRKELAEVDHRLAALKAEGSLGGRLTVIKPGEMAMMPYQDWRARASLLGLFCGAALPILLLILPGILAPRYRSARDAAADLAGKTPLFAVLPDAKDMGDGSDNLALAAGSVHHIRLGLGAGSPGHGGRAYLVTSSSCGQGRTSLTLALGISCAASGSRTLLVDFDPARAALTAGFDASAGNGLEAALVTGSLMDHVSKTRAGLSVLCAGRPRGLESGNISQARVRQLLDNAREHFDIVLIDSAPILGGLAPSILAREVDGVLLLVACGQEEVLVERSIQQLQSLDAPLAGIIFNRASAADMRQSLGSASSRAATADPLEAERFEQAAERMRRFGALAGAVLWSVHLTRREDLEFVPGTSAESAAQSLEPRADRVVAA